MKYFLSWIAVISPVLAIMSNADIQGVENAFIGEDNIVVAPGCMLDVMQGFLLSTGQGLEALRAVSEKLVSLQERRDDEMAPTHTEDSSAEDFSDANSATEDSPDEDVTADESESSAQAKNSKSKRKGIHLSDSYYKALTYLFPEADNNLGVYSHTDGCKSLASFLASFKGADSSKRTDLQILAHIITGQKPKDSEFASTFNEFTENTAVENLCNFLNNPSPAHSLLNTGKYLLTKETLMSVFLYKYLDSIKDFQDLLSIVYELLEGTDLASTFFATEYTVSDFHRRYLSEILQDDRFYPVNTQNSINLSTSNFTSFTRMIFKGLEKEAIEEKTEVSEALIHFPLLNLMNNLVFDSNTDSFSVTTSLLENSPRLIEFYKKYPNTHVITAKAWSAWRALVSEVAPWDESAFAAHSSSHSICISRAVYFVQMLQKLVDPNTPLSKIEKACEIKLVMNTFMKKYCPGSRVKTSYTEALNNLPEEEKYKITITLPNRQSTNENSTPTEHSLKIVFNKTSIIINDSDYLYDNMNTQFFANINYNEPPSNGIEYIQQLIVRAHYSYSRNKGIAPASAASPLGFIALGVVPTCFVQQQARNMEWLDKKLQSDFNNYYDLYCVVLDYYTSVPMYVSTNIFTYTFQLKNAQTSDFEFLPLYAASLWRLVNDIILGSSVKPVFQQRLAAWKGLGKYVCEGTMGLPAFADDIKQAALSPAEEMLVKSRVTCNLLACAMFCLNRKYFKYILKYIDEIEPFVLIKTLLDSKNDCCRSLTEEAITVNATSIAILAAFAHDKHHQAKRHVMNPFSSRQQKVLMIITLLTLKDRYEIIKDFSATLKASLCKFIVPLLFVNRERLREGLSHGDILRMFLSLHEVLTNSDEEVFGALENDVNKYLLLCAPKLFAKQLPIIDFENDEAADTGNNVYSDAAIDKIIGTPEELSEQQIDEHCDKLAAAALKILESI